MCVDGLPCATAGLRAVRTDRLSSGWPGASGPVREESCTARRVTAAGAGPASLKAHIRQEPGSEHRQSRFGLAVRR